MPAQPDLTAGAELVLVGRIDAAMNNTHLGPVILDIKGLTLEDAERDLLQNPVIGGLILFARNYSHVEQLQELVGQIRDVRPELVIAVDQEGGRVQRLRDGFTRFPPMQRLGELFHSDPEFGVGLARDCGWLLAAELVSLGIDISFAPVLDLDDNFSSIIGDRAFAKDPGLVITAAGAFMEGMHEAGMATTGKHFPGHGSVQADSHHELPVDARSWAEVAAHDLRPFKQLAKELDAVMPAHMLFPAIDDQPVGFSSYWLQDVLRKQLQFDGVIFSDDLSMAGAAAAGDCIARAELALQAGCDSILICNSPHEAETVVEHLTQLQIPLSSRLPRMRASKRGLERRAVLESGRCRITQERLAQLRGQ